MTTRGAGAPRCAAVPTAGRRRSAARRRRAARARAAAPATATTAMHEERRADAAAAPAERVVRDGDAPAARPRDAVVATAPAACAARRPRSATAAKPRTFSHISAAARAADAAPSHARMRRLSQPGDSTSQREELAHEDQRRRSATARCSAVEQPSAANQRSASPDTQRQLRIELQHEHGQVRRAERAAEQRVREHAQEPHRSASRSTARADALSLPMTIVGRAGRVHRDRTRGSRPTTTSSRSRRPRSPPPRAPGQFVMVKPKRGIDPLLRRPFSIFEILRDADGTPHGICLLNKRVGVGTGLLFDAEPATGSAASGRSASRSCRSIRPPKPGWSPAASDSRRLRRWPKRWPRAAHDGDAVLRRAPRRGPVLRRAVRALGVRARARDRGRQPRRARLHHRAARARAAPAPADAPVATLCLRADADDARGRRRSPPRAGRPSTCRSSR